MLKQKFVFTSYLRLLDPSVMQDKYTVGKERAKPAYVRWKCSSLELPHMLCRLRHLGHLSCEQKQC